MRYLTIALAICLAGCATQLLDKGLKKSMGMPIDVLVAGWGYPSDEREIMGHKMYIWSNNGGVMAVPVYGGGVYANSLNCTVQIVVDDNKMITGYQWSGNNGGCATFANRIAH